MCWSNSHLCLCVNLDVEPKCLRFLSVAEECAVLPRRGYFFASCCLVKTLARRVSEVSCRMQQKLYGFTRGTESCTSQREEPEPRAVELRMTAAFYCEELRSKIGLTEALRLHCLCENSVTAQICYKKGQRRKVLLGSYSANSLLDPLFKGLGKATSSVVLSTEVPPSISLFSCSQTLKQPI